MESVNRTIWDEWGAMPSNEQARDEAAGILDGLPSRARGEEIMFISPRLFAVRRLMRLWGECCSCPADGQQDIRLVDTQIKGKIVFAADYEQRAGGEKEYAPSASAEMVRIGLASRGTEPAPISHRAHDEERARRNADEAVLFVQK